ncbi:MAG: TRAP transporter large permease subunit [Dehalococcoidales bacterium]|nr:TRAP transporter large permease subunit [Dehalococcoidales bacterium]
MVSVESTSPPSGLEKVVHVFDKVGVFARWTNIVGVFLLFTMIVLNFVDVILDTKLIHSAISGATELTEVMMICGIFLAVAHSQNEKGHIVVDLVTSKLSQKGQLVLGFIVNYLAIGTIGLVIWRTFLQTLYFADKNVMHGQYLGLPSYIFMAVIVIGVTSMFLLIIRDFLKIISDSIKAGLSPSQWAVMLIVPLVLTVFIVYWMQPQLFEMELTILAVIGIAFFLLLLLAGMPIYLTMMLTAVVFIGHIRGPNTAFNMIATDMYRVSGSYGFAVMPFFMLMGFFCLHAKYGADLYVWGYRWFGHLRGGLSIATIGACTMFAAIVGDPIASVSTMGSAAYPEMKKYKYSDKISAGSIVGGSSLGPIIPPSSAFILVGLLTGLPIAGLLVSGVLPGILLAASFILVIVIWCRINPNLAPAGEKTAWGPRLKSLTSVFPVLVIFIVSIGGIYLGFFTPTRGGAVGAFTAFVLALLMRRFTWKSFIQALLDGGKAVSTVFFILIAAQMFTRFIAWCNVTNTMTEFITNIGLGGTGFMIITMVFLAIMGCFIDVLPMILIGLPIFYPIAAGLGIDPIWFSLLFVMVTNLGGMTPPFGVVMFVFKGIQPTVPMSVIYRGTIPFVLTTVAVLVIIFLVPGLATWLPGLR